MRRFKLINAVGEELDLMARDHFFHLPSGLGYQYEYSSTAAGYDFVVSEKLMVQKEVSGEMAFLGSDPYKSYQLFTSFCAKSPLKLAYSPQGKWYYLRCEVKTLEKSEISTGLICPVDFIALSTWYEQSIVFQSQTDESAGKIYEYTYPYIYADTASGVALIQNRGNLPAYTKIHIMGPCTNPSWALEQGGEVLVRGKIFAGIPKGDKLVVSSSPGELEIAEYTTNNRFVRSLYQNSDFSTGRFVIVPVGDSRLQIGNEGGGLLEAYVEVQLLAESV